MVTPADLHDSAAAKEVLLLGAHLLSVTFSDQLVCPWSD
ncbi:hypothetical protein K388_06962 [Streptomyces sp. KhCrAH-43]|nr:hypothetical protein K388_06962 [Streptomyces sp. KhCrAH-43]